jgi:SNF2 family DNA or RNA helicase
VCSLTAADVGLNLQVATNIVLAEMSWADAEQAQAIDSSHRIRQAEPVTPRVPNRQDSARRDYV